MTEEYLDSLEYVNTRYNILIEDKDVPVVPNLDAVMLRTLIDHAKTDTNGLDMLNWHSAIRDEHGDPLMIDIDETNWCRTTHCRAGYAICLAGKDGWKLERMTGPEDAGTLIYLKSTGRLPSFYGTTKASLIDIILQARTQGFVPEPGDVEILASKYGFISNVSIADALNRSKEDDSEELQP